jgi:hypothetical protein
MLKSFVLLVVEAFVLKGRHNLMKKNSSINGILFNQNLNKKLHVLLNNDRELLTLSFNKLLKSTYNHEHSKP